MNDEIEMYVEGLGSSPCYIESLAKTRKLLSGKLLKKLDVLIEAELDLALMGTEKARSEIIKASKNNITPINPGAA